MYLSVSEAATSSVLVRQEDGIQKPVYYTSKALLPAETRYSPVEKMALALITAARKLRPYFQAHRIRVYTNCPLKLILQKPEVSGRLTKWAIELSEFDVEYLPRTAIKAQAVADFVAEFTEPSIEVARMMVEQNKKIFKWQLRVDGSSNTHGSGAGVVLTTPEGDSIECALRFDFKATNNQAEYEALIAGLKISTVLGADEVEIFSDSQVVVNQVLDEYQAREESMITYLELARELLERFKEYRIVHVPREENEKADALAKLASATINIWPNNISMIRLLQPSIVKTKEVGAVFGERNSWITPIKEYLVNDILPSDPLEAKRLKYRATRYSVLNGELYKRGYSRALQRCVGPEEAEGILRSIHSGNCGNHAGGASLAHKTLRQGFYWPTLFADSKRVAARCEACQKIANNIRQPPELLQSITSPWPFAMWGIDLIGPMPTATGGVKHAIVAVDYFTKWVEAEPLVHITEANTISFVKKNILYRFGIPNTIITDNGTQFDGRKFRELCDKYGINNYYASPVKLNYSTITTDKDQDHGESSMEGIPHQAGLRVSTELPGIRGEHLGSVTGQMEVEEDTFEEEMPEEERGGPAKELEEVVVREENPPKTVKIGSILAPDHKAVLQKVLRDYNDPTDDLLHSELLSLQATDIMGKEFISVTDAEEFYKKYSYCMGFSMRKDRVSRDTHGLIKIRRWVCSKEGYRSKKNVDRTDRLRQPRGQTREGCRASFRINLDKDKMLWVVTEFVTEHSHILSPGNHSQFLRCHRNVKDSDLSQVQSLRSVGMKTSQVMDHLVDQAGSYAGVGHTGKDLQNRLDTIRRSATQNFDADSIISYMTAKSEMDQRFFFRYTIMEDGSMVTDGDRAMGKAISLVMPAAVHRLCSWHLERNVQTNVGDSGFTQAFTHCMLTYMTESEFETQWLKAIETFGVQQNEWVKLMYCKRKLWAETCREK
ncbi:hypothetical protein LWI29_020768 [Acer saccharum]|uniref:Uncharacterized protein n=1 Tax=Acer saccharum TaxID=4024 RepID=A0AA39UJZ4_ACESA|nr:hypothetical protein LWI29_020768 [Acer saccharum]